MKSISQLQHKTGVLAGSFEIVFIVSPTQDSGQ